MDPNQPEPVPIGMVPSPAEQQRPAAGSGTAKAPTGAKQQPNNGMMGEMKKILTWQDFHGKDLTTVVEYEPRCAAAIAHSSSMMFCHAACALQCC